jgi:tight adherence protein C
MALIASFSVFAAVLLAITLFGYVKYVKPSRLIDQLSYEDPSTVPLNDEQKQPFRAMLIQFLSYLGNLIPLTPQDIRLVRHELDAAGFRGDLCVATFTGTRVVGGVVLCVAAFFLRDLMPVTPVLKIVMVIGGGVGGYFAPGLVLDRITSKRREKIRFALPDALDLLVICAEAGCGLDQSLVTVSRELVVAHPVLCEELNILNLETLAGKTRPDALRNFATRTGEEEVQRLVALLVQTDRFGTSVSEALRTQSEAMRVQRRQQAEERAGKIGVKLVFPIFFFCLPSLFIIAAGPGMLQLFRNLPMLNSGGH